MTTSIATPALRPARPDDLSAVEALLTASGLPTTGVPECLACFMVAEADGRLVGVAGLEIREDVALLRSVAVDPEWRSRGLGRRLVEQVVADAVHRGLHALYLLTTTAERYFPSFGFTRTTRDAVPAPLRTTAEFTEACPASAAVMERRL